MNGETGFIDMDQVSPINPTIVNIMSSQKEDSNSKEDGSTSSSSSHHTTPIFSPISSGSRHRFWHLGSRQDTGTTSITSVDSPTEPGPDRKQHKNMRGRISSIVHGKKLHLTPWRRSTTDTSTSQSAKDAMIIDGTRVGDTPYAPGANPNFVASPTEMRANVELPSNPKDRILHLDTAQGRRDRQPQCQPSDQSEGDMYAASDTSRKHSDRSRHGPGKTSDGDGKSSDHS